MSTEFAVSRFLTPILAKTGWALFMDCDVLARISLARLFEKVNKSYAVMVVKHEHEPTELVKMDGQAQSAISRKNWSSVMAFQLRASGEQGFDSRDGQHLSPVATCTAFVGSTTSSSASSIRNGTISSGSRR